MLMAPGEYTIRVTRGTRPIWQISDKDKEKSTVKSNIVTLRVTG